MAQMVRIVATPEVAAGFSLAGVPTIAVRSADEGPRRLAELVEQREVGVVLVEEGVLDTLAPSVRSALLRRSVPIVVPIPRPVLRKSSEAGSYLWELLQRAVGYRLRLR